MCRPVKLGGLGVLQLQSINLALLMKWVSMIKSNQENLVLKVLRENYRTWLDWHGLKHVFPEVHKFFTAILGDNSLFHY